MQPLILDIGSHTAKIGLSNCTKNHPDIVFASEDIYPSDPSNAFQGFRNETSVQLDHFEATAREAIRSKLNVKGSDHPLLLVVKPGLNDETRKRILEFSFEDLCVPAFHFASEPLMTLYSVGLASGIVLASGHSSSYVSTVHNGHIPPYGTLHLGFGGSDVTQWTRKLLHTSLGRDVCLKEAEEIKLKHAYCHQSQSQSPLSSNLEELGRKVGDMLINSNKDDFLGFPEAITRSIYQTDEMDDYEPVYFRNIVLCGGNTMFEGLKEKLESEITPFDYLSCGVRVVATPFRQYAGWIGGSIAASLPTFKPFWITHCEYSEYGDNILKRKCLPY